MLRSVVIFLCFPFSLFGQHSIIDLSKKNWSSIPDFSKDSIICLGEEHHWVDTYLEIKNDLIKHLHQEHQFDVVIFESGFVNAFVQYIQELEDTERLQETLYTLWQRPSTLDLMEYFSSKENKYEIIQLGCDLKGPKSFRFSNYLKKVFTSVNPNYASKISFVDSSFIETRFNWEPRIGEAYRSRYMSEMQYLYFQKNYTQALDSVIFHKNIIQKQQNLDDSEFNFFKRCLHTRLHLLELMQLPTYQQKHQYRDSIMGDNLDWLISDFVPDKKYIIWGADIHISKDAKWEANGTAWQNNRSMIEHLITKSNKNIFSLGIKPRKSIKGRLRRKLKLKRSKNYYINLNQSTLSSKYKGEHDALIICGTTKTFKEK